MPSGPKSEMLGVCKWARKTALVAVLLTLPVPWACDSGESTGGSPQASATGFYQSDSAGVLVSVTQEEEAFGLLGWEIDSVPELVLGAESEPDEQFFRIAGVLGLPDGGILVVNAGSQELRIFDSEGGLVRNVGGKGEGPGEFRDPTLVRTAERDSVLLWDISLRRLQAFSSDGLVNRTVPLTGWPRGAGSLPPVGAVGDRLLIRRLRPLGPSIMQSPGVSVDSVSFVWLDAGTGDTTHVFFRSLPFFFAHPPNFYLIPLTVRPHGAVVEDGAVITGGADPEIRKYGLDGRLLQVSRINAPSREVTDEDLQAYVARQAGPEYYEEMMARFRAMPLPDFLPWFDELQVDARGWVWAKIYDPDRSQPKEWVVFDKAGRAQGTIRTPPDVNVRWVGDDRVLGVWLDDLGVEHVHSYGLQRDRSTP